MSLDIFILYIIWIVYIFFESAREANLRYQKITSKANMDIKTHVIHNVQKIMFLLVCMLLLCSRIGWYSIPSIISMILILPYLHNNTYYLFREKLEQNKNCELSCEEKPSFYMNCKIRKKLFVIGCILQIITFYIKYYL